MKHFKGFACVSALLVALMLPGALHAQTAVTLSDPNLEAAVRAALGKPTGELTSADLLSLQQLPAASRGITSLSGLEGALNLQVLDLSNNQIQDAGPLAGLTALHDLFMDGNQLHSGAPLAGLANLHSLLLNDNAIQDTSWLVGLTQLQELSLIGNPLGNGAALAGLTNLTDLYVNSTGIADLGWAAGLVNLVRLGAGENGVTDASPLAGLTGLQFLGLGGSPLVSCAPLAGLTSLQTLYLYNDSLTDVSCLAGLRSLTWLRLADNQIRDIAPLAGLTALEYLDLSGNPVGDCGPLAGLTHLTGLDLGYDYLTNASCLSGLTELAYLGMSDNQISDGSPLAGLSSLQSLDLSNNLLNNLEFTRGLTDLTNLNVAQNQLTDINGLLGLMNLSTVDLLGNPLEQAPSEAVRNVIGALRSRGVSVSSTVTNSNSNTNPPSPPGPPLVVTNATYTGLVYGGDGLTQSNSGCLSLRTTVQHRYSAKLQLGGRRYSLSGSLASDGAATNMVKRAKQPLLVVELALEGSNFLTGRVAANGQNWSADILGYRNAFDGKRSLCQQAGRYTLAIGGSNSPAVPDGSGYGTVKVSPAGKLTLAGSLADGTRFTQSASVSDQGFWPLYVRLYSGKGALLSWLAFTNADSVGGELAWTRPYTKAKRYGAGFAGMTQAAGARYLPPGKGTNAFGTTDSSLTLTLTGGGLKQALATQFTLDGKNQVKDQPAAAKLKLSFNVASGRFQGRTVDPDSQKGVSFSGVVLQSQTNGLGYFLGSTNSGQVLLSP